MISYDERQMSVWLPVILLLLLPLVIQAHLIDPDDFNQDDLAGLQDALAEDKTDEESYDTNDYNCFHFARDVQYNLWHDHEIESLRVHILYSKNGEDSEHNGLKVKIRNKDGEPTDVFVEPQSDKIYTDVENLLQGLQFGEQEIDVNATDDNRVIVPFIGISQGGTDVGGCLFVSQEEEPFTINVSVMDMQRRPATNQTVTITVTHADGSVDTFEGTTDDQGQVQVNTSTKQGDFPRSIEVEATIHVLPQDGEGQDTRDSTHTKKIRIGRQLGQYYKPSFNGIPPNPPVYVGSPGQTTNVSFTLYNTSDEPREIHPIFQCRRNCDTSEVLEATFDPPAVYIEPCGSADVDVSISNLTAAPGDTVMAQISGGQEESIPLVVQSYATTPGLAIDTFTAEGPSLLAVDIDGTFPVTSGDTALGGMIGGSRDVLINMIETILPGAIIHASVEDGTLHYAQDSDTVGELLFHYDGGHGWDVLQASEGLNGVDLTLDGTQEGISVYFEENNYPFNLAVLAFSGAEDSLVHNKTVPVGTDFCQNYAFDEFLAEGSPDWTSINALVFYAGPNGGMPGPQDFSIDYVGTYDDQTPSHPPHPASAPFPADGSVQTSLSIDLSWTPGKLTDLHNVYFSDSFASVSQGYSSALIASEVNTPLSIGLPESAFPEPLVPGTTYHWRVDGINNTGTTKGQVWSFEVQ